MWVSALALLERRCVLCCCVWKIENFLFVFNYMFRISFCGIILKMRRRLARLIWQQPLLITGFRGGHSFIGPTYLLTFLLTRKWDSLSHEWMSVFLLFKENFHNILIIIITADDSHDSFIHFQAASSFHIRQKALTVVMMRESIWKRVFCMLRRPRVSEFFLGWDEWRREDEARVRPSRRPPLFSP